MKNRIQEPVVRIQNADSVRAFLSSSLKPEFKGVAIPRQNPRELSANLAGALFGRLTGVDPSYLAGPVKTILERHDFVGAQAPLQQQTENGLPVSAGRPPQTNKQGDRNDIPAAASQ